MKGNKMKTIRLILAAILTAAILLSAFACGKDGPDNSGGTTEPVTTSGIEQTGTEPQADKTDRVRFAVLNGTTGFGIAPMYVKNAAGKLEGFSAEITLYTDASLIPPLVISKNVDVAAVPTNLASVLYNKTEGGIKVLAVNTLGVLYLIENGNTVNSVADLAGKTVYLPGQGSNPEYLFKALVKTSGIEGLEDRITLDFTYPSPDELTTAVASGKADIAVLPQPKVTAAMMKNENLRIALDFTDEWKKATGTDLVQGCIIARSEFVEDNPGLVSKFLAEYSASVDKVVNNPDEAAKDVAEAGIAPNEALVKKALPYCNIVYMAGEDMKAPLKKFWQSLYDIIPSSVGGKMPDDNIFG